MRLFMYCLAVLVASLALTPAVTAKIPAGGAGATAYPHGTICGASRCVSLTGAPLNVLANGIGTYKLLAKQAPAPYYRIDIFKSPDYGHRFFWIPSRHAFRVIDGFPGIYLIALTSVAGSKRRQRLGDQAAGTSVFVDPGR